MNCVLCGTRPTLSQARANLDQAERAWHRAAQLTQLGPNLIAPETAEQARTSYDVAQATWQATRAQLAQSRASLQEARDNLAKTRLTSPIAGRTSASRLNIKRSAVARGGSTSSSDGRRQTFSHPSGRTERK